MNAQFHEEGELNMLYDTTGKNVLDIIMEYTGFTEKEAEEVLNILIRRKVFVGSLAHTREYLVQNFLLYVGSKEFEFERHKEYYTKEQFDNMFYTLASGTSFILYGYIETEEF